MLLREVWGGDDMFYFTNCFNEEGYGFSSIDRIPCQCSIEDLEW